MRAADHIYGRQLEWLTDAQRLKLRRCVHESPDGCNDETCSPPCYTACGISFDAWRVFWRDERDRMAAAPVEEGQP